MNHASIRDLRQLEASPVFDWYQATVPMHHRELEAQLIAALGVEHTNQVKGAHAYAHGLEFVRAGDVVARMLYGGTNGDPNVTGSGEDAQQLAEALRDLVPEHRVTRVDSAYDFRGPDSFAVLFDIVKTYADGKRLTLDTRGDWTRPEAPDGRTLYVGSPSSPIRVRLYEKGKQLRKTGLLPDDKCPLDWVRVELQLRPPSRDRKEAVAAMSPAEVWSFGWAAGLHELLELGGLQPASMHDWRAPDDARAWKALLSQYGKLLTKKAFDLGELNAAGELVANWPRLGLLLEEALSAAGEEGAPAFDVRAAGQRLARSRGETPPSAV